jgi:hypothetical protein
MRNKKWPRKSSVFKGVYGAGEEIRTPDPRITNALLYRLSYTGIIAPECRGEA